MRTKISIIITLIIIYTCQLKAQQQLNTEKTTYRDSLNRFYVQTSLPLYLYVSTKPNDSKPQELSAKNSDKEYNNVEPMYMDGNGVHHIQHFDALDKKPVVFVINADGIAPQTNSFFENSPTYTNKNKIYFGKNLQIRLTYKDDMSGVNKTYYSINNENFREYTQPVSPGIQNEISLKYYSADNVGNVEKIQEKLFIIDTEEPKTYYNVTGISKQENTNIISTSSIIYLEPTDKTSGIAKTYYKFDNGKESEYNGKNIPISQLDEGEHILYYYSIDNVQNKETEQKLEFFLDKSAPIVATDVLGDRFIVNNQVYFSGRSKLKITAVDNKIGVKEVKYSIDNAEFKNYEDPFYLPSKPGIHVVRYYAVDSLENKTVDDKRLENLIYRHTVSKIYVDLTGPALNNQFIGDQFVTRDTLFINFKTKIKMDFNDTESGKQKLTYSIDNNPTENQYTEPITINENGFHKIDIIGYDNVNNRNYKTIYFVVDNVAPEIFTKFSVEPIGKFEEKNIYPPFVEIFVAPTDNLVGIKQILYTVNNSAEKEYAKKIDGFIKGQKNIVTIKVIDNLLNTNKIELQFYILEK